MEKIFFDDDTFSATLHLNYVESNVFKTEAFITYELKNKSQFYSQLINVDCSSEKIYFVKFEQTYESNLVKSTMLKQQLWKQTEDGWKIFFEGRFH